MSILKQFRKPEKMIYLILFCGLVLRLIFVFHPGDGADILYFKSRAIDLAKNGFWQFYRRIGSDEPPFSQYILKIIGETYCYLTTLWRASDKSYLALWKMPSFLADLGAAYLLYYWLKREMSLQIALLGAFFYLVNPAIFYNAAVWGQNDSLFLLIQLVAFFLIYFQKPVAGLAFASLAALTKTEGLIILPLIIAWVWKRFGLKEGVKGVGLGLLLAFFLLYPFNKGNLLFLFKNYLEAMNHYPFGSIDALNIWWFLGGIKLGDTAKLWFLSWRDWGLIFFSSIYCLVLILTLRKSQKIHLLSAASLIWMAAFLFLTRRNGTESVYALPFLILLCCFSKIKPIPSLALTFWSLMGVINLQIALNQPTVLDYHTTKTSLFFAWVLSLAFCSALLAFVLNLIYTFKLQTSQTEKRIKYIYFNPVSLIKKEES